MGAMGFLPLHSRGIEICDGQAPLEAARAIKSEDEIAWLDDYHREVREALAPLVDADTADWLEQATRPLGA